MNLTHKMIVDPEAMLPKVEAMLFDQAWAIVRQCPVTFEEARSEAYEAFMEACCTYDKKRGSQFQTWCFNVVKWKLCKFIEKRSDSRLTYREIENDERGSYEDHVIEFEDSLDHVRSRLSEPAELMLDVLLTQSVSKKALTPKRALRVAKDRMAVCGHKTRAVRMAQVELKSELQREGIVA